VAILKTSGQSSSTVSRARLRSLTPMASHPTRGPFSSHLPHRALPPLLRRPNQHPLQRPHPHPRLLPLRPRSRPLARWMNLLPNRLLRRSSATAKSTSRPSNYPKQVLPSPTAGGSVIHAKPRLCSFQSNLARLRRTK
jgi:hypothetical protein